MSVLHVAERSASYALQAAMEPAFGSSFDLLATAPHGVEKLRQLILSLAIRGKLVTQMRSEGTARDLLDAIRLELPPETSSERRKVIQAEMDADCAEIFDLPQGWEWSQLGNVVDVVRGITFPASEKTRTPLKGRIACLRTTNVQRAIEWDDLLFVNRSFVRRDEQLVQPLDIIMSMANSKELVGKVALVDDLPWPEATIGGFIAILRPRKLKPRYLMLLLRTDYARSTLIDSSSQTTNIANISLAKLRPLPIPVPPLAEQASIVARVEELMQLCDALEAHGRLQDKQHARLVATLFDALAASESAEALAENWQRIATHFDLLLDRPEAIDAFEQTLLQLAVRGLLVPQDSADEPASELLAQIRVETNTRIAIGEMKRGKQLPPIPEDGQPFELPEGWVWTRFAELGEFGRGKSKRRPRNDPRLFSPGVYPLIQTGEVSRADQFIEEVHSKYSEEGLAQSKLWPRGTLCITIAANIADSAILTFDACFPDSVVGFVPAEVIGDPRYFLSFMNTARQRLIDFAPATAQKNINLEVLNNVLIPLPPLEEMRRIVARVEQLRGLCAALRERLQQSRATQSRLADALVAHAGT